MAEQNALYVLLAPVGQLTGNGQLRETVKERRNRKGKDVSHKQMLSKGGSNKAGYKLEGPYKNRRRNGQKKKKTKK